MKIETSQVKMQTQTQSHFESSSHQEVSFLHEVIGFGLQGDTNSETTQTLEVQKEEASLEVQISEAQLTARQIVLKLILEMILERFLGGKQVKFFPQLKEVATTQESSQPSSLKLAVRQEVSIERTIEYSKKQSIDFSTQACIKTNDKEIKLDLQLSFTQEFYETHKKSLHFEEVSFLDPLVIQYDQSCQAFDMVDEELTFTFDINSDETCEELPLLKDGNGFLVLDKDGNGSIDNGNEMFGPNTNDGFAELAQFDEDGNNWIDENDPIFDKLRIWTKNSSNEDELLALGQVGIGALYLTQSEANITIDKSVNESLAHLKSNSIYLKEDGTAGVISALDFIA